MHIHVYDFVEDYNENHMTKVHFKARKGLATWKPFFYFYFLKNLFSKLVIMETKKGVKS